MICIECGEDLPEDHFKLITSTNFYTTKSGELKVYHCKGRRKKCVKCTHEKYRVNFTRARRAKHELKDKVLSNKLITVRVAHDCCVCLTTIQKGYKMLYFAAIMDHVFVRKYTCLYCYTN
jgi:hypothetical protein